MSRVFWRAQEGEEAARVEVARPGNATGKPEVGEALSVLFTCPLASSSAHSANGEPALGVRAGKKWGLPRMAWVRVSHPHLQPCPVRPPTAALSIPSHSPERIQAWPMTEESSGSLRSRRWRAGEPPVPTAAPPSSPPSSLQTAWLGCPGEQERAEVPASAALTAWWGRTMERSYTIDRKCHVVPCAGKGHRAGTAPGPQPALNTNE
nr:uncharacterized protein LOC131760587 isoform X2 [Kogia breviceps]